MNGHLLERAAEMHVRADFITINDTAAQLDLWLVTQTAAIDTLGPRSRTRAVLSIRRVDGGERVECAFTGSRGATYTVVVVANARTDLTGAHAQVADATAAFEAMAALLEGLVMTAALL